MSPLKSPLAEEIKALRGEREEKLPEGSASREALRKKRRIYLVTDTSWWLEEGWKSNNKCKKEFFFIIPKGVLQEIDGLKKNKKTKERAVNAQKEIYNLIKAGNAKIDDSPHKNEGFLSSRVDEEVISVAKKLKKEDTLVVVLTTDNGIKAVCESIGIPTSSSLNDSPLNKEYWIIDTSTWIDWGKKAKAHYIAEAIPDNVVILIPGSILKELDILQGKNEYEKSITNAIKGIKKLKEMGKVTLVKGLPSYKKFTPSDKKKEIIDTYKHFKNKGLIVYFITKDKKAPEKSIPVKNISLKLNPVRFLYEFFHYLRLGLISLFLLITIICFFKRNFGWSGISLLVTITLVSLPELFKDTYNSETKKASCKEADFIDLFSLGNCFEYDGEYDYYNYYYDYNISRHFP